MGAVWGWVTQVWNFAVSIAPTVFHTACQIVEGASKTITLP